MALFRRKPRTPTTGHGPDDGTLQQLAQHGVDFEAPRDWVHYVYCDGDDGVAQMQRAAEAAGWTVRRAAAGAGIVANRDDLPVNAMTVPRARAFFEGLAADVPGGEYDGWDAAV